MNARLVAVGDLTPEQRRVHRVEHILRRDGGSPGSALEGLASIIEDETWRKVPARLDDPAPFKSFRAFVETPAPIGLGYSIRQLQALLKLQHPDEEKMAAVRVRMDGMREAIGRLLNEGIQAAAPVGANQHSEENVSRSPLSKPDTAHKVIARLKRDDPKLADQVVRGEITGFSSPLLGRPRFPAVARLSSTRSSGSSVPTIRSMRATSAPSPGACGARQDVGM